MLLEPSASSALMTCICRRLVVPTSLSYHSAVGVGASDAQQCLSAAMWAYRLWPLPSVLCQTLLHTTCYSHRFTRRLAIQVLYSLGQRHECAENGWVTIPS